MFYEIFPASFQDSSKGGDGIGDLRGITMRLDYLKKLGVRGIRLNSIFPAAHYPEYYANIENLTDLNRELGTLDDFATLVRETHRRNMSLILDLPLYPFVKTLHNETVPSEKPNKTDKAVRERRDVNEAAATLQEAVSTTMSLQAIREALSSIPPPLDNSQHEAFTSSHVNDVLVSENLVTTAIKIWLQRGVDGFYLKGLEHYANEKLFAGILKHWKSILGSERILICHVDALNAAKSAAARNSVLMRMDLVDVTLRVTNGTKDIKRQIEDVTNSVLFEKPGYPWVYWSIGGVDSKRIASTISVKNATIAATMLGMMLPGTPNIFYGDEV